LILLPRAALARRQNKNASRPISRVLYRLRGDDHSSGPCVATWFSRPTRARSADGPALLRRGYGGRVLLFGLAPGGACRATFLTVGAVGSYPTVSALPVLTRVSHRRSILCGAIPRIASGGRYPPPYPRGARTFLEHSRTRGRPADWRALCSASPTNPPAYLRRQRRRAVWRSAEGRRAPAPTLRCNACETPL